MINELPEEILIDIFSRLPAKSVGKCRCLSKPWKSLLSSPEFIKSHLDKSPRQETLLLMSCRGIYSISPIHNTCRALQLGDDRALFAGSINGLVLLLRGGKADELFLANPTTLQQVKIPDSPLALKGNGRYRRHGFGYDSCSDDYKIVMLSFYDTHREHRRFETVVDVYSLKMGVWRRVGTSPYDHTQSYFSYGAFVNGCVHWLARSWVLNRGDPSVIAAFELGGEVFDEVPAPDGVDVLIDLAVLGGCLCLLGRKYGGGGLDFWIMKQYGLSDSWMWFSIDVHVPLLDVHNRIWPLCFAGNENDVVLVIDKCRLAVYNRETETFRDMVVDAVMPMFGGTCTYVESLVSPTVG